MPQIWGLAFKYPFPLNREVLSILLPVESIYFSASTLSLWPPNAFFSTPFAAWHSCWPFKIIARTIMAFSYLHGKTFNGLGEGKKLLTSVSHALLHFAPVSFTSLTSYLSVSDFLLGAHTHLLSSLPQSILPTCYLRPETRVDSSRSPLDVPLST